MAVQKITHKKIIKYDIDSPNYKPASKPKKEVDGNIVEEDVYGERKHTYVPDSNGNLQMEQLMGKVLNKLDNYMQNYRFNYINYNTIKFYNFKELYLNLT